MSKIKSVLALLLVAALCISLLAACASTTNTQDNDAPVAPTESTTPDAGKEPTAASENDPDEDASEGNEDIVTIELFIPNYMGGSAEGAEKMAAAVNEVTEREIGVHVNVNVIDAGSYDTVISLGLTSGDQIDLMLYQPAGFTQYSTMLANAQLMDAAPYLHEYAQEALDLIGPYMESLAIGDAIYGMPAYRNYASASYLLARVDLLESAGLMDAFNNMTTWEEYIDICKAVREMDQTVYGIACRGANDGSRVLDKMECGIIHPGTGSLWDYFSTDTAGDNLKMLSAKDDVVTNIYQQDVYIDAIKRMAEWYDEGVLFADSMATEDSNDEQMKQGVVFSMLSNGEYGVEASKEAATGYDLACIELAKAQVMSGFVSKFGLVFSANCREPEASAKFLNLLMKSEELNNLFVYGIEGEDYVRNADGTVDISEDWNWTFFDFAFGNQFLMYPLASNGPTMREESKQILADTPVSPYMGFSFDTSALSNTVANLTSVYNEFIPALSGGGYTDALYQEFVDKLTTAGIDEYVSACQEQLDAWMAQ